MQEDVHCRDRTVVRQGDGIASTSAEKRLRAMGTLMEDARCHLGMSVGRAGSMASEVGGWYGEQIVKCSLHL